MGEFLLNLIYFESGNDSTLSYPKFELTRKKLATKNLKPFPSTKPTDSLSYAMRIEIIIKACESLAFGADRPCATCSNNTSSDYYQKNTSTSLVESLTFLGSRR